MSELDQARQAQEQSLERVRALVEYWDGQGTSSVPESHTRRQRLEGLAHSILTAIDQDELALIPTGLPDSENPVEADVSGELNGLLFNRGMWRQE